MTRRFAALAGVVEWPVGEASVAVVGREGVLDATGAQDAVQGWASLTKMVTALATLTLVDDATIGLDDPAGPPNCTIRHLLAHASGLPFDRGAPIAEPGRRRIYGNASFEVLADEVADAASTPIGELISDRVLEPLGMDATRLYGSPAHGLLGPLSDLILFAQELLRPTLLRPELFALATAPVFPELDGVLPGHGQMKPNPWGLGFEIRGEKTPHWSGHRTSPQTFGHFGGAGSFLWVDPVVELACCSLSDTEFGPWALEAWPKLSDDILDAWRI